jgi:hypothetical protein
VQLEQEPWEPGQWERGQLKLELWEAVQFRSRNQPDICHLPLLASVPARVEDSVLIREGLNQPF